MFSVITLLSIDVTPTNPTITVANTQQFTATGNFSNGSTQDLTNAVTWSTSVPGVASIGTTGLGTGVTAGTTTITATQGTIAGSTVLTVNTTATLVRIDVTPQFAAFRVGETQQYTATAVFSDASTTDVTNMSAWTSERPLAASINPTTGLATGVANLGQFQFMTATFGGLSGTSLGVDIYGGGPLPGAPIATATDTSLIDDYILPDVGISRSRIMVVKANSSSTFESHVLLERYFGTAFPAQMTTLTPTGSMVDFGGTGSFIIGSIGDRLSTFIRNQNGLVTRKIA